MKFCKGGERRGAEWIKAVKLSFSLSSFIYAKCNIVEERFLFFFFGSIENKVQKLMYFFLEIYKKDNRLYRGMYKFLKNVQNIMKMCENIEIKYFETILLKIMISFLVKPIKLKI